MSAKFNVLVIDDEAAILRFLKPALEANNYEITSAGTVAEGVKRVAAETPDIVLLDLGLPDGDGKDVIRRAREWSDVPIIVLSAREREAEKIEALDLGADDYINKPFNIGELLARMRTALRHRMQRKAEIPVLRVGTLEVDAVRHRATRARRRTQADAEGIRASVVFGQARRPRAHSQADPDRGLGTGAYRRHAISARLYRPAAPEGGRASGRSASHPDRTRYRISNSRKLSRSMPLPSARERDHTTGQKC